MFKDGAPATPGISRAALLASVMLVTSLALGVWSWQIIDRQRQREASARFDLQRDRIIRAIGNRMLAYQSILEGAQGLFAASQRVSRQEFRAYVDKLDFQEHFPGIQGIGYSEFIEPARLNAHIENVRGEGFAEYAVTPAGMRDAYTAIVYLEPFDWRNRRAFGYDMFSEPVRRAAMEQARDSGKNAVSDKLVLVPGDQQGRSGRFCHVFAHFSQWCRNGNHRAAPWRARGLCLQSVSHARPDARCAGAGYAVRKAQGLQRRGGHSRQSDV